MGRTAFYRHSVRRLGLAALVLASGWFLCGFGGPRLADEAAMPSFDVTQADLRAIQAGKPPSLSARAALLLDVPSDRILYEHDSHEHLAQASTTKIMTALLTLESQKLDDVVTVSDRAAAEPGTRMGLVGGERLTVRQLLYGLLLPSGNDAAIALAQYEAGSIAAFVARMNGRAQQLGLRDTHFVNPDGLDDPNHYSSAYDLAQLALFVLGSQPGFDEIVKTVHMTIPAGPGHPEFVLTNLNQLLTTYPGADGVKTGTTPRAGQVLVAAATRSGRRLLAVILGSQNRYADAKALLDFGFGQFVWVRPGSYQPEATPVLFQDAGGVLLPAWEARHVQEFLDVERMRADLTLGGRILVETPLELLP